MSTNILLLDLGNSRLKWAVYTNTDIQHSPIHQGSLSVTELQASTLKQQWQKLKNIQAAYICAVGQPAHQQQCADLIQQHWQIKLQTITVSQQHAGVNNSYQHPQDLGVDRWMALLAAHQLNQHTSLIASLGTATTLDIIDQHGQHQGGYIVPGLTLMQQSLGTATAAEHIQPVHNDRQQIQPANSTQGAVANGVIQMQIALIEKIYQQTQPPPVLLLTGGAAEHILPFLNLPYQLESTLVFKGMLVHIQYLHD